MSLENISLQQIPATFATTINLTGSKSESNRALILEKISGGKITIKNLSSANDTVVLHKVLHSAEALLDIGPAGTAMRFATAYFAIQNDGIERVLTGSERMKQRPIGILVDALRALGADISYVEKEGFPPLRFSGRFEQQTDTISIAGNVSSQFISALLLVAPSLPKGLKLTVEGLASQPYIEMTIGMLREMGVQAKSLLQGDEYLNVVEIPNHKFDEIKEFIVEPDWSAASYWYAFVALSESADILLPNLKKNSLQGDSAIADIMSNMGVISTFDKLGLRLRRDGFKGRTQIDFEQNENRTIDFSDCPDLAQTVVVVCAALQIDCKFTGLKTLKIKETDRVKALQTELKKIGADLQEEVINGEWTGACVLKTAQVSFPDKLQIATYEDHRMAMAFAPLLLKVKEIEFEEKAVVAKSYPSFWEDVKKLY